MPLTPQKQSSLKKLRIRSSTVRLESAVEEPRKPTRTGSLNEAIRRSDDEDETETEREREKDKAPGSPSSVSRRRTIPESPRLPDDPAADPPFWCERPASKTVLKTLSKSEMKRQEGIYELVQTERGYVRHLAILHHCFRQPIIDEGLLSPDQLHTLFANLSDLTDMSNNFCRVLSALVRDTEPMVPAVGTAFLEGFARIDPHAYAVYCSNQNAAAALYREKKRGYAAFNTRIMACEAMPACDRLSFVDFVVKPLQRLTKYPLLLKVHAGGRVSHARTFSRTRTRPTRQRRRRWPRPSTQLRPCCAMCRRQSRSPRSIPLP